MKDKKEVITTVKEIPMYDPYTVDPNPEYETLTGKKNPYSEAIHKTYVQNK